MLEKDITYCCIDCGNKIHWTNALYKTGRCHSCGLASKECKEKFKKSFSKFLKKNPNFKKGKNNPMFGKVGYFKGKKRPEVTGKNNGNFKGGKHLIQGYVYVLNPEHPFSNKQGYIMEHRLIMEKHIERYLTRSEQIHHINLIKTDNRIENLKLFLSGSEHHKYEHSAYRFLINNNLIERYDKWYNKIKEDGNLK